MRVGVVTTSYPRSPGDWAGGFVAEHVRWLERAGHRVDLVAPGRGPGRVAPGAGLFAREGAPERLASSLAAWGAAGVFSAALVAEVRRRARGWDAAVAHWLAPCGVAVALAGVPATAVAHSGDVHVLARLGLVRPVAALLARAGVRVVFVSESLREQFLARAGGARLSTSVSPMGVDVAHFARLRAGARAGRHPIVLFVGRLVAVKGVDTLVAAAARLRGRASVVVAGDGPLRDALRARAGGNVRFVGAVDTAARDRWLARADAVAVPSVRVEGGRTEGTPRIALEALAAGVPVVASRVGGLAELAPAGVELVAPGDPDALAGALDRALRRASPTDAAREWVDRHDWDRVGPKLVPALQQSEMNTLRRRRSA